MYIKYDDQMLGVKIRDVRDFELQPANCAELDGSITHGIAICDGRIDLTSFLMSSAVESLASFWLDSTMEMRQRRDRRPDPVMTVDGTIEAVPEIRELAWFNSLEAARSVMDRLSDAISSGARVFDLTAFGEDGELKTILEN